MCRYSFVLAIILLVTACGSSGSSGDDDNILDGDFDNADQDYSTSCTDDQDCARGFYCDNGYCRDADCDDEHPCQDGYTCEDHICIPTGGDRDNTTCPDGYKWDSINQECIPEDGDDDFDLEIEEEPLPVICDPGTPTCHGNERVVCNDAGTAWEGGECEEGTICLIDTCVTQVCNAGTVGDCRDEYFVYICNNHGTGWEETLCEDHFACLQGQGCQSYY